MLKEINYDDENDIDNRPMNHAKKTIERFKFIPEGKNIAKIIDKLPPYLLISKFYLSGNSMRLNGSGLSPALVPGHNNFPIYTRKHRNVTVKEVAVISSLIHNYKFFGNHSKRCENVENAVPPFLAKALAKECYNFLEANT